PSRPAPAAPQAGPERAPAVFQPLHRPDAGRVFRTPGGAVREVHAGPGRSVLFTPGALPLYRVQGPGQIAVASPHGRWGYLQRPVRQGDEPLVQRTYVGLAGPQVSLYRPYAQGGSTYYVYTPHAYYRPAFYTTVQSPWPAPVPDDGNWRSEPWYGRYHDYYSPQEEASSSPLDWLTNRIVAMVFKDDDTIRREEGQAMESADGGVPMSAEARQGLATEVGREVQEESSYAPAQGGPTEPFQGAFPRIVLVSTPVNAWTATQSGALRAGDVVRIDTRPDLDRPEAQVTLMASRTHPFPNGSVLWVGTGDLNELLNQMRADVDRSLGDLQSRQGSGGLPPMPPEAAAPPSERYGALAQPDPQAGAELAKVSGDFGPVPQGAGQRGAAPSLKPGMTLAQVQTLLGQPRTSADLGAKKIYFYPDLKVTFLDNRVTDIQ
ncbi:MAG: hypothetical protein P4L36_18180, partial [Holophaga sp.]|nr:hypothetical protein [Holophaga sp.]